MSVNKKGPFEVQIPYVAADGFAHTFRANAIVAGADPLPGVDPSSINLVTRSASVALDVGVNALWTVLRAYLPLLTLASGYSFWKIPTTGGDPVFITSGDLTTPDGATGAMIESQQEIRTFRSALGGIAKIVLMDTPTAGKERVPLVSGDLIAAYVVGPTSWLIARDDSFLIGRINLSRGENETLFKARHRK